MKLDGSQPDRELASDKRKRRGRTFARLALGYLCIGAGWATLMGTAFSTGERPFFDHSDLWAWYALVGNGLVWPVSVCYLIASILWR
jgi:hypothetical protein